MYFYSCREIIIIIIYINILLILNYSVNTFFKIYGIKLLIYKNIKKNILKIII